MVRKRNAKAGTLYLVHVLTHSTRLRLDRMLAPFGLSSFQYTVLSVIAHNDGLSSARLSRRFHVTPQAMGELILILEKKKFIARVEDPKHRRILHITLTSEARDVLAKADALVADFEKTVFQALPNEAIVTFRDTLETVLETLREPNG